MGSWWLTDTWVSADIKMQAHFQHLTDFQISIMVQPFRTIRLFSWIRFSLECSKENKPPRFLLCLLLNIFYCLLFLCTFTWKICQKRSIASAQLNRNIFLRTLEILIGSVEINMKLQEVCKSSFRVNIPVLAIEQTAIHATGHDLSKICASLIKVLPSEFWSWISIGLSGCQLGSWFLCDITTRGENPSWI